MFETAATVSVTQAYNQSSLNSNTKLPPRPVIVEGGGVTKKINNLASLSCALLIVQNMFR